mgnify:CR=1 FL=1
MDVALAFIFETSLNFFCSEYAELALERSPPAEVR